MIMDWIDSERKARKPHKCRSAICMHKECEELLGYEGFYNEDDYGTDDDFFHNAIFDYVNEHHISENGEAFDNGWDGDNYHLVKMILKELKD